MARRYRIGATDWNLTQGFCGDACAMLDAEQVDGVTVEREDLLRSCDLLVTHGEYFASSVLPLHAARRLGVPTLHVMDGVLEWRNSWENPRLLVPFLRPIIADKVACIGRSQVRILESWGNQGRCELVGAPRLDRLLERRAAADSRRRGKSILVMSAKTPFFTGRHRQLVLKGFEDLRSALQALDGVEVHWRVADPVAQHLGLSGRNDRISGGGLWDAFDRVTAVISMPSTAALEAMLYGLPVALLDYTNSPAYLPGAWSITARDQIDGAIAGILEPDEPHRLYQEYILHDSLECRSPASPRLAKLMEFMIDSGRRQRSTGQPGSWPYRILEGEEPGAVARAQQAGSTEDRDRTIALLQNEVAFWREDNRSKSRAQEQLHRMQRYGCGPLLARLVHTFPYPRRMSRALRYWLEDRRDGAERS